MKSENPFSFRNQIALMYAGIIPNITLHVPDPCSANLGTKLKRSIEIRIPLDEITTKPPLEQQPLEPQQHLKKEVDAALIEL